MIYCVKILNRNMQGIAVREHMGRILNMGCLRTDLKQNGASLRRFPFHNLTLERLYYHMEGKLNWNVLNIFFFLISNDEMSLL